MLPPMAAPPGLNPQASEYVPLLQHSSLSPLPPPAAPSSFIPATPLSWIPFPYPSQLVPHIPSHPTPIYGEPFHSSTLIFSFSSSSNFSSLPPPPPPPPPSSVTLPPPPAPPPPSPPSVRVSRGPLVRGSGFGGYGGREREMEMFEGQCSHFSEEKRSGGSWSWRYLKKHGMRHLRLHEYKTTVMIKNIPYEYTRQMLVDFLDNHCMLENQKTEQWISRKPPSAYDFLYIPVDFKTKKNKGYAFVNFTQPSAVWNFYHAYNNTRWDFNDSPKIRKILCARIQGKEALVRHFEKSYFECESDEFLPVCFTPARDGSGASVHEATVGQRRGKEPV